MYGYIDIHVFISNTPLQEEETRNPENISWTFFITCLRVELLSFTALTCVFSV